MGAERGRCIGLIGGLGLGATILYYKALLHAHEQAGVIPDLIIMHADVNRVVELAGQQDSTQLAHYLAEFADRMAWAGARIMAITAVTPHLAAPSLRALSPIPLISLVDAVSATLIDRKLHRVALFGTRFTIDSKLFGGLDGFDVVTPNPDEVDTIHRIYMAIVTAGEGTEAQATELGEIAHRLIAREHLEAIVLAGTELGLAIDADQCTYPAVDCARVHVAEIMRWALRP